MAMAAMALGPLMRAVSAKYVPTMKRNCREDVIGGKAIERRDLLSDLDCFHTAGIVVACIVDMA